MSRTCFLYRGEQAWRLELETSAVCEDLGLEVRDGSVLARWKDNTVCFSDTARLGPWKIRTCVCEKLCLYERPEPWIFGRDQLTGHDPSLSRRHFRLEKDCLHDESLNGTFVNGLRVKQTTIRPGTQILCGTAAFLVLPECIVSSVPLHLPAYQPLHARPCRPPQSAPLVLPVPQCQELRLESGPSALPQPRTSLFQTAGPALMIGLSSLAAAGTNRLLNPAHAESSYAALLSAGSMAVAFLAYGFINARLQKQNRLKDNAARQEGYSRYLQELEDEVQKRLDDQLALCHTLREQLESLTPDLCLSLSDQPLALPCGQLLSPLAQAEEPRISYAERESVWVRRLQKARSRLAVQAPRFQILQEGERFWLPPAKGKAEGLLALHLWLGGLKPGSVYAQGLELPDWLKHSTLLAGQPESAELVFCQSEEIASHTTRAVLYAGPKALPGFSVLEDPLQPAPDWEKLRTLRRQSLARTPRPFSWQEVFPLPLSDLTSLRRKQVNLQIQVCQNGQPLTIDFAEEAAGPHALIAGTTGSGKSEFLTSVLLQLAARNDPAFLQWILIDFKGGAFAGCFSHMSHTAGLITNLAESDVLRFEKSLRFEIEKREQKLRQLLRDHPYESAHIDTWNRLYPKTPMSHLFIIVDEFAQLKSRLPSSMQFIKELARIGRSIGLHLILATQKPSGIVDEQIWSNSRLKVCFQVHSAADSREVIGCDKASQAMQPGSGWLLIGSADSPQPFASLYTKQNLQEAAGTLVETDADYHPLEVSQETVLHHVSDRILQHEALPRWIVHPPLSRMELSGAPAFADRPEKQDIQPLAFVRGSCIEVLFASRIELNAVREAFADEFPLLEALEPEQRLRLWQAESQKGTVTVLLQVFSRQDLPLIQRLQKIPWIRLVLLSQQAFPFLPPAAWKIACASATREERRAFLGGLGPAAEEGSVFVSDGQGVYAGRLREGGKPVPFVWRAPKTGFLAGLKLAGLEPVWLQQKQPVRLIGPGPYPSGAGFIRLQGWSPKTGWPPDPVLWCGPGLDKALREAGQRGVFEDYGAGMLFIEHQRLPLACLGEPEGEPV